MEKKKKCKKKEKKENSTELQKSNLEASLPVAALPQ